MAMVMSIFQLILWEFAIPILVGTLFWNVCNFRCNLPFWWISGQMLLWAVFQIICVPMILCKMDFMHLVRVFAAVTAVLLVLAAALFCRRKGWRFFYSAKRTKTKREIFLWGIFALLLLFQLVQAVRMAYADGDDAYYVALTTITNNASTMYQKLPYTGGTTALDVRHGLAPFPMWISYLTQVSGLEAVTVAHIAVPLMLISMTYGIFYLLGERISGEKRELLPLFLVFSELLVLFGDYSFYTAENFMIARSRQGKAALGNIMIPMLFLLLLLLLQNMEEQKKNSIKYWGLFLAVMISACMCSTLGSLLGGLLVGVTGVCSAAAYKKWRILIPILVCCLPCVIFAGIYIVQ